MSTALVTLTKQLAGRLDMGDGTGLIETLKATAFKGQVSDAQMTALLIVSNQYGLNPWTKEIYAFPDKNNGIVPVVGVDGWARILNGNPQYDGMDFDQNDESCTCRIYRKDRSHPTEVTEYMSECKRPVGPWQSHPKRMLRHKAMIQCARIAFGFGGIYDQDEAERIVESTAHGEIDITPKPEPVKQIEFCADANFQKNKAAWQKIVESGKKTPDGLIVFLETKAPLTEAQKNEIKKWTAKPDSETVKVVDAPAQHQEPLATQTAADFNAGLAGDDDYTPE